MYNLHVLQDPIAGDKLFTTLPSATTLIRGGSNSHIHDLQVFLYAPGCIKMEMTM